MNCKHRLSGGFCVDCQAPEGRVLRERIAQLEARVAAFERTLRDIADGHPDGNPALLIAKAKNVLVASASAEESAGGREKEEATRDRRTPEVTDEDRERALRHFNRAGSRSAFVEEEVDDLAQLITTVREETAMRIVERLKTSCLSPRQSAEAIEREFLKGTKPLATSRATRSCLPRRATGSSASTS